jgi:hypothetical protein
VIDQRAEVPGERVVVEPDRGLVRPAEPATVVGDAPVAGAQQHPFLPLPGVEVEGVAVDEHDRLPGAVVLVVQVDVGAVLGADGDERHGGLLRGGPGGFSGARR